MDQQQSTPSTPASDNQGYQALEASPEDLGLSPSGKLELPDTGEKDDIAEALAAAAEAVPLEPEPGESQAEDAEVASPSKAEPPAIQQETKPEETPAPNSNKVSASDWARFHREKRDFFAEQQQVKADRAEIDRVKGILANAKQDRLAALEALGYTDIKEFVQGLAEDGGRMTPERRELNELKAWREKQESAERDRAAQLEQKAAQDAVQAKLDTLRGQVKSRITSEDYSNRIVNLKDADEQVMLEMDRMATETGQMPDIDEAIERVEGRFTQYLGEMAANPAIMAFFGERLGNRQSPPSASPQSKQRAKVRTIGGNTPSPSLQPQDQSRRNLSLDEEVEEAINGLKAMVR